MSERLIKMVNDALIKEGVEVLRERSKLSPNTIRLIADRRRSPRRRNAYKLALACGCSEEEALALARECSPTEAKDKAG